VGFDGRHQGRRLGVDLAGHFPAELQHHLVVAAAGVALVQQLVAAARGRAQRVLQVALLAALGQGEQLGLPGAELSNSTAAGHLR